MHPLVYSIVNKTSRGLTTSGFEKLAHGTPCLFVGNHRDIVLDSAILQVILLDHGHETSEITFGSNLMTHPFIIDLGKVNRMFKVKRGGNSRELLKNSQVLSAYIRYTLTEKRKSAWIAQRGGRTKDGNDKTETGLLKMFHISDSRDFHASFEQLHIVPLAVSYEYEPCCAFKIKELTAIHQGLAYQKEDKEDLNSIITGITQNKGHIHLAACTPVNTLLHTIPEALNYNEKICKLAGIIDQEIYSHYKLWPTNYIAFDMLHECRTFSDHYTPMQSHEFMDYMKQELRTFNGDTQLQQRLLLSMYAAPVINAKLQLSKSPC
jgi:hypothetical protein